MLSRAGLPVLIDFGLAKVLDAESLTATGAVLGTPVYMAPEQATGLGQVGPAADIYGLGATLFFMLTGEPPFPARGTPIEVLTRVLTSAPRRVEDLRDDVSPDFAAILARCLEKAPEARYASAILLAHALATRVAPAAPAPRRRAALAVLALSVLGLLALTTAVVISQRSPILAPPQPPLAGVADEVTPRHAVDALLEQPPDLEQVRASLQGSTGTSPTDLLERGVSHARLSEFAEAQALFEQALAATDLDPGLRSDLCLGLAHALEAQASTDPEKRLEALAAYEVSLIATPRAPWRDAREACWERLLAGYPADLTPEARVAKAYAELGVTLRRQKRTKSALKAFDEALRRVPDSIFTRHWRALALTDEGRFEEALADYTRLLELEPSVRFHLGRARTLTRLERREDAVDEYTRAFERWPVEEASGRELSNKRSVAHFERGLLLRDLGRNDESRVDLTRALELKLDRTRREQAQSILLGMEGR